MVEDLQLPNQNLVEWFDRDKSLLFPIIDFDENVLYNSPSIPPQSTSVKSEIENLTPPTGATLTLARKFYLNLSSTQREKVNELCYYRNKVYNICIRTLNLFKYYQGKNDEENKNKYSFIFGEFLCVYKKLTERGLLKEFLNKCPDKVQKGAIKDFCSNLKSNLTQVKNKTKGKFTMKFLDENKRSGLYVEEIGKRGIFSTYIGNIKNFPSIHRKIKKEGLITKNQGRIVFNKSKKRYYLHLTFYKTPSSPDEDRDEIMALDPGVNKFLVGYDGRVVFNFNQPVVNSKNELRNIIKENYNSIKILQRQLSQKKNRNGKKLKNKDFIKRKIRKCYRTIKNKINSFHWICAQLLTSNYTNIIIPEFGIQNMIASNRPSKSLDTVKNKRKTLNKEEVKTYSKRKSLNRYTKFEMSMLSHYSFRTKALTTMCLKKGSNLFLTTEEYTSKCCGLCGELMEDSKTDFRFKECKHCGFKIDRDCNGSRNIFIKSVDVKEIGCKPMVPIPP